MALLGKLELASNAHAAPNLCRTKLAPLGECGVAILFEYMAVIKMAMIVKMVVKLTVNGNEFLQCLMTSKPLHGAFPPFETVDVSFQYIFLKLCPK